MDQIWGGCTAGTSGRLGYTTPSKVWSWVLVYWTTAISKTSFTNKSGRICHSEMLKSPLMPLQCHRNKPYHKPYHINSSTFRNCKVIIYINKQFINFNCFVLLYFIATIKFLFFIVIGHPTQTRR